MINKQTILKIETIIELLDSAYKHIKNSMQILAKLEDEYNVIPEIHDYDLMSVDDLNKIWRLMDKFKSLLDGYRDILKDKGE